ncbi:MAG: SpoIIE family protein phosphatase [Phycisphaeraceae bacterium]|nr:SpoIIE family protein phosphatase [Phycisphaeraceae bacterium]
MRPSADQFVSMEMSLHTLTGAVYRTYAVRSDHPALIGRLPSCDVCLLDERVSRKHATLAHRSGAWVIVDHGSTQGSYLNGTRLEPEMPTPLEAGDLVRIAAWTFRVCIGSAPTDSTPTLDDAESVGSRITSLSTHRRPTQTERCLKILAECMTTFNNAADETTLACEALRAALDGSGYARAAALVRTGVALGTADGLQEGAQSGSHDLDPAKDGGVGGVRVVATLRADESDDSDFVFSGSLVREAASGKTAILTIAPSVPVESNRSIAELSIHSALCAPVYLGDSIEGFLYLDARAGEQSANSDAPVFCEAVSRAYGLALANLKRRDLQRRQAAMQIELAAAREVQEFILPPARAEHGFLRYSMLMKPGLFVAGDLFDVVPLDDGRVAVCLGDVAGHGIGSAMLMSVTQSYLNGQIRATGDPSTALVAVNRYLCDRLSPGRFVTLWLGVFAPDGRVWYVDAGHSYWMRRQPTATSGKDPAEGTSAGIRHGPEIGPRSIPIGIFKDARYEANQLHMVPGSRLVLYSDGIAEERDASGREFGIQRLALAIDGAGSAEEDVQRAFAAVHSFSHSASLSDDATVASIEIESGV